MLWRIRRHIFTSVAALMAPRSGVGSFGLFLANGSYVVSGRVLALVRTRRMPLSSGSFTISGQASSLTKGGGGAGAPENLLVDGDPLTVEGEIITV